MDINSQQISITVTNNSIENSLDTTRSFGIFLNKSLTTIKMVHWYIDNYNAHKILGNLYDDLSESFDKLQEEIIGTVKQQNKLFPQISLELDSDNIQNYNQLNTACMESYYKANQMICSVLNSQEFKTYTDSVVSGLNNTREEIISALNKANYLLDLANVS